jgi:hypothetical protein
MNIRTRKAVGAVAMLSFLAFYVLVAATLAGHLPDNRAAHMAFFVIAGMAWCLPLVPLVYWMENGRFRSGNRER